jgi:hypothetical protein
MAGLIGNARRSRPELILVLSRVDSRLNGWRSGWNIDRVLRLWRYRKAQKH